MEVFLYTIYDKCSGLYSEPFTSVNDDVAKRRFKQICVNAPTMAGDLQLYKLGKYVSSTGEILLAYPLKPEFLEGGVANG